ncbi:hypothetical protein KAI87_14530 [Myxococcota bacterium]|nr:hypothetical protein [Myxococcota bacterium]
MLPIIGLDVGYSEKRKTCGLAVRGLQLQGATVVHHGSVQVGTYNISAAIREVARLMRLCASQEGAVFVIDAPVSPKGPPRKDRSVDSGCSRKGFYLRAQSYPVTQKSGVELANAAHRILTEAEVGYKVLCEGGKPQPGKIVVAETNPTTAMAMALPQQETDRIPSRKRHIYFGQRVIRAKSDWYWAQGAGAKAAAILGEPSVETETHHERVAALFCLALASELSNSESVAIGDDAGVYVVPTMLDKSWQADVERVGVAWGEPRYEAGESFIEGAQVPVECLDLEPEASPEDTERLDGDEVELILNDSGGINRKANPWLHDFDGACMLKADGIDDSIKVEPFSGSQASSQSSIDPTASKLIEDLGLPSIDLSKTQSVSIRVKIVGGEGLGLQWDSIKEINERLEGIGVEHEKLRKELGYE